MFVHAPIDQKRREIRLLKFRQPQAEIDTAERISLELKVLSLNEQNVSYSALSYVWGTVADTIRIEINDSPFLITKNLHNALQHLQKDGVKSWLWIDAICIAQNDCKERSHQINAMRHIFAGADFVYMWLGLGSEESDVAIDFISRMGPSLLASGATDLYSDPRRALDVHLGLKENFSPNPSLDKVPRDRLIQVIKELFFEYQAFDAKRPLDSCFLNVLTREYWSRAWITQEVVLARRAIIMVGPRKTPLELFDATLVAISHGLAYFLPQISLISYLVKPLEMRRDYLQGRKLRLADILWECRDAPGRPHYTATDPREIVFGVLGIIFDVEAEKLRADYSQSFEQVFIKTTRVLLDSTLTNAPSSINFSLDFVHPGHPNSTLPTWVPDWRKIGAHGVETDRINGSRSFASSASRVQRYKQSLGVKDESRYLLQNGCLVDVITDIMTESSWQKQGQSRFPSPQDQANWFSAINSFAGLELEPSAGEDYVWRTMANDSYHTFAHGIFCNQECDTIKDLASLCRSVMRSHAIEAAMLTAQQTMFIKRFLCVWQHVELSDKETLDAEQIKSFGRHWRHQVVARNRHRILFKTAKGMPGRGRLGVDVGDVVTLVWGVPSPIVLRRRDQESFYFQGDAYVDGIMHGEYLATHPEEKQFIIF